MDVRMIVISLGVMPYRYYLCIQNCNNLLIHLNYKHSLTHTKKILFTFFNIFQQHWKVFMNSVCLLVWTSRRALTLITIFELLFSFYALLIFSIECSIFKGKRVSFFYSFTRTRKWFALYYGLRKKLFAAQYIDKDISNRIRLVSFPEVAYNMCFWEYGI